MYCTITKDEMKIKREDRGLSNKRTLKNIKEDFRKFTEDGSGDLKYAKIYNNAIEENLFDIEIDQVYTV